MSNLRLVSHHLCPYVQRAIIVLTEKNIPHERIYIDLADKPDWFHDVSPLGRVPVLQADESVVFESQVIAEYLDEITHGSLHPADPLEKAKHRSWIEFGSKTLAAIAGFYSAKSTEEFDRKRRDLQNKFRLIDREIAGLFFAGDTFHLIDGVWGTIFRYFDTFDQIGDFGIMTGLPKVEQWRKKVSQRPSVVHAPPEGYPERLKQFLWARNSILSGKISEAA